MRTRHAVVLPLLLLTFLTGCSSTSASDTTATPAATKTPANEFVEIPDLVGMTGAQAADALADIGVNTRELTAEEQSSVVLATAPAAGRTALVGGSVSLTLQSKAERAAIEQAAAEQAAAEAAAAEAARIEKDICGPAREDKARLASVGVDAFLARLTVDTAFFAQVAAHCPEFAADVETARRTLTSGKYVVGTDIPAGTYTTVTGRVEDSYWSRTSAIGDIIDNDFISFSPGQVSVSVRDGEGFEVNGCGMWLAPAPLR